MNQANPMSLTYSIRNKPLARKLKSQARELDRVAGLMRRAATLFQDAQPRLSPEGRERISQAAVKRWDSHRKLIADQKRALKAKQVKSGNQKV